MLVIYIKELLKNDFDKNGFQIDTFQRDWIETLNSMNNEVDEFITSDPNVTKNFSESWLYYWSHLYLYECVKYSFFIQVFISDNKSSKKK